MTPQLCCLILTGVVTDEDQADEVDLSPLLLRSVAPSTPGNERSSSVIPPAGQLDHYQLNPEHRLKVCLEMAQRAYEEYAEACAAADSFSGLDMPDGTDDKDYLNRTDDLRKNVRTAYNRWLECSRHAKDAEQEVRKRKLEQPLSGEWKTKFIEIRVRLQEEYSGLGPQYDLLCDNLASVSVRIRQLEESGRDYDAGEYIELMKLYLTLTNQLQKYTEAMKSESINKQTQDVALRIIGIFERHFGQTDSVEWRVAVREIRALAEGVEAA